MTTQIETFVLVQMLSPSLDTSIARIIRTYLTAKRAEEDRELMAEANPLGIFRVLTIQHIDD